MKKLLSLIVIIINLGTQAQTWNTQLVNPGSITTAKQIAYDNNNYPVVVYKSSGYSVALSFWDGNSWKPQTIYNNNQGITVGNLNILHVDTVFIVGYSSYYSGTIPLRLVQISMEGNQLYSRGFSPGNYTGYNLTNTNSSDSILISYYGLYNGGINYVSYNLLTNSFGNATGVDASIDTKYPSITVSPNNDIWLSYYDASGRNLKVAKSGTVGDWDIWFLDTDGDVGNYSQIWVDNSNIAHIAYYDATNQKLKYATFSP